MDSLAGGIPDERSYHSVLQSQLFHDLEGYSEKFLALNSAHLSSYAAKWVADPLHQWSRQWEYPFVLTRLRDRLRAQPSARVLDAGSGVSFFPYYLRSQFREAAVVCCDSDPELCSTFRAIDREHPEGVRFCCADLRRTPYANCSFDVVYSVSVLEHTDRYSEIVAEMRRVIRPGGSLIVTFDLSLDGTRDTSPQNAALLLAALTETLVDRAGIAKDLRAWMARPGRFTTQSAVDLDPSLLPWKRPSVAARIAAFARGGNLQPWPPRLTVFCLELTRPDD